MRVVEAAVRQTMDERDAALLALAADPCGPELALIYLQLPPGRREALLNVARQLRLTPLETAQAARRSL